MIVSLRFHLQSCWFTVSRRWRSMHFCFCTRPGWQCLLFTHYFRVSLRSTHCAWLPGSQSNILGKWITTDRPCSFLLHAPIEHVVVNSVSLRKGRRKGLEGGVVTRWWEHCCLAFYLDLVHRAQAPIRLRSFHWNRSHSEIFFRLSLSVIHYMNNTQLK